MAGKNETRSGHFNAVNRLGNEAFRPPKAEDLKHILETSRPFLQVVGIIQDAAEEDEILKNTPPPEIDITPMEDLSAEENKKKAEDFLSGLQSEGFGEKIDSGYYGEPALIEITSGWIVHYWPKTEEYPPAMCVSAGNEIIGGDLTDDEQVPGTVVNRAFDAAAQLILIAMARRWSGIQIVSGTDLMQWAAWAVADKNGLPCYGYEPDSEGEAKAERIADIITAKYNHKPSISSIPVPIIGPGGQSNPDQEDSDDSET